MTTEWEHFVAGVSPALLEQERVRVHGVLEQERVGSRTDLEMRFAHDFIRRDVWEKAWQERTDRTVRLEEEDADRFIAGRGAIEAAIRSYSQRQAAAAAERKTAA